MTPLTNIHVAAAQSAILDSPSSLPRLRTLTNDPAREYAQRPGEVERLPDSVAALILCKKGFSKVLRNGITVEGITRKPLKFWSENSVTIATKAGTNDKVLWVINRLQPDVLHILTPDGAYVETIPLDEKAEWFEPTMKVLGAKRRSQARSIDRVRELHAPDTEDAVAAATANDEAMKNEMRPHVHTFPVKEPGGSHGAVPSPVRGANGALRTQLSPHDRTSRKSPAERIEPQPIVRELSERNADGLTGPDSSGNRGQSLSRAGERSRLPARGDFSKAERLHQIQREIDGARTAHAERTQTLARRVAAITPQDLDDLTNDGPEPIRAVAFTATENHEPEEDLSDLIL